MVLIRRAAAPATAPQRRFKELKLAEKAGVRVTPQFKKDLKKRKAER